MYRPSMSSFLLDLGTCQWLISARRRWVYILFFAPHQALAQSVSIAVADATSWRWVTVGSLGWLFELWEYAIVFWEF